jgi:hypothetical protein
MIGVEWEEERKDEEDRREKRETKQAKLLSQRSRTDKNKGREEIYNSTPSPVMPNKQKTDRRVKEKGRRGEMPLCSLLLRMVAIASSRLVTRELSISRHQHPLAPRRVLCAFTKR